MGEVIDIKQFLKHKKFLTINFNAAWNIFEKYAQRFQRPQDLSMARQWMDAAMMLGFQLDMLVMPK